MNPARITFIRKRSSARLLRRKRSESCVGCVARLSATHAKPAGRRSTPPIGCLNGCHGWLEVECVSCRTRASLPLDAIRRGDHIQGWIANAGLCTIFDWASDFFASIDRAVGHLEGVI